MLAGYSLDHRVPLSFLHRMLVSIMCNRVWVYVEAHKCPSPPGSRCLVPHLPRAASWLLPTSYVLLFHALCTPRAGVVSASRCIISLIWSCDLTQ